MSNTGNALKGSPFEVFLFLERARKPEGARVGRSACLEGDETRRQKPRAADRQGDARREQAAEGAGQDWQRRATPPRERSWPDRIGLQRALKAEDYVCEIIAPPQIPKRPGVRIKTDGRDCLQLAECSRWTTERRLDARPGRRSDPGSAASARRPSTAECTPGINSKASCCATTFATPARPRGAWPTTGGCRHSISTLAPPRRRSQSIGGDHHV